MAKTMIKLLTPTFRVSFPNVFEPRAAVEGGKKEYSMAMLFTLDKIMKDPTQKKLWEAMKAACMTVANEKWPKGLPKEMQNPFRKGEEKDLQGYGPGVIFINGKTRTKPGLVDQNLTDIISPEHFYAGCYARARVNPYAWEYMGKKGVSFGLQNIQKVADGEPFSGRTAADKDFDAFDGAVEAGDASTGETAEELFG